MTAAPATALAPPSSAKRLPPREGRPLGPLALALCWLATATGMLNDRPLLGPGAVLSNGSNVTRHGPLRGSLLAALQRVAAGLVLWLEERSPHLAHGAYGKLLDIDGGLLRPVERDGRQRTPHYRGQLTAVTYTPGEQVLYPPGSVARVRATADALLD